MKYVLKTSIFSLVTVLLLGTAGCSSSSSDSGGGTTSVDVSGNAVDGYLRASDVCYDLNSNLICDAGEPSDITGDDGSFDLTVTPEQQAAAVANASLLVSGGIDIDTNLPFVGVLRAPYENTDVINVTPLTTMASAIVSSGGSIDDAYQQVADALGLDVSLVAADPVAVATTNPEVIKATMTIQRIVKVLAAATVADDNTTNINDAMNDIYVALADAVAEVADSNTSSGMAAIVEAAAADANSTLTPAAITASVVASIIEGQVSDALADGYTPDDALVIDEAVEVVEDAVVTAVEDDTPIDTATVEADADDAATNADPVLSAVENLLVAYSVSADENQTAAIAGSGFNESVEVTAASVSVLTITDAFGTQSVIDALALAYRTEQVELYIANLGQSVSSAAIDEVVALTGFDAAMTTAAFSELIYATGNAELMALALTVSPPAGYATLSDVEQAKALFTELRTQAMSVVDYNESGTPGYLDDEAADMDAALNSVVLDTSYMADKFDLIMDGIDIAMETNQTTISTNFDTDGNRTITLTQDTTSSDISWSYDMNETGSANTWSGTLTYPDINDTFDTSDFTTLTAVIAGTFPLDYEPVTTGEDDSQSFDGSVTVTKTSTGADISIEGEIASNGDSIELSNATAEIAYGEDAATGEPTLEYFKFHGLTLVGTVEGYTVNGTLTVNSYAQNTLLAAKGGTYEVQESGFGIELQCSSGDLTVSDVTFTYDSVVYTPDYSYADVYNAYYDFYNIDAGVQYNEISTNLNYTATCDDGVLENINWNWFDSYTEIANNGWLPNDVTFSGAITNTATGGAIAGELNAEWLNVVTMDLEDGTQDPLVRVTLDGTLNMPTRPEMALHIGFENTTTQNTIEATYAYDTTGVSASGVFDKNMTNGDIVIEAATGIRADIAIVNEDIDYVNSNVTKGGLVLGTFEDRAGVPVIKYIDGTFESLP